MAQTPKITPRDIEAENEMIRLKRIETKAVMANTAALKAESMARGQQARTIAATTPAVKKAGDAMEDLGDHADEATESFDELGRAQKGSLSAFQSIEKAAGHAGKAIEGMQAAYKLLVAANYDHIHAANMAMRAMQNGIPKSASVAGAYIDRLTVRFKSLREEQQRVSIGFIVDWQEALADMDKMMEAFGINLDTASAGTEKALVDLQRRMYAMREMTGASFEEQLQNMDYAVTHLGLTAEAYMDQIEAISKAPQMIREDLQLGEKAMLRYKDILKTNGIIRAVNDMVKALDMENVSVKKLAGSYSALIEQSIKYGRTQKQAIEYAEKVTKGLYGVGNEEEAFQFQNYNAGLEYLKQLKSMGLGGANDKGAQDKLFQEFLDDMGVTEQNATEDQKNQARMKVKHLKDVAAEGDVNAGVITDFAPTEARMKAKMQASKQYSGLMSGGLGLAGVETFMKEVLGVQQVNHQDAEQFYEAYKESGGDMDMLAKKLSDLGKKIGAPGALTPDELAAQEKIAQERKLAEAPDVIAKTYMGPNSLIVEALQDSAKSLTSIDGAVGYLAGMSGYAASKTAQKIGTDQQAAATTEALQKKVQAGTATTAEQQQYQQQLQALKNQKQEVKDVRFGGKVGPDFQDPVERLILKLDAKQTDDDKRAQQAANDARYGGKVGPDFEDPLLRLYKKITRPDDAQRVIDQDANTKQPDITVPGHAAGLKRVPWDNYLARLHEGEMVLPKMKANMLRDADLQMPTPQQLQMQPPQQPRQTAQQVSQVGATAQGNMMMEARAVGDKLVFTVPDAGMVLAELLSQARPSRPT